MDGFTYDEAWWPLVRIRAPAGPATGPALEAHLAHLGTLLSRRASFAIVLDLGVGGVLDVAQRERVRQFLREHTAEVGDYVRGVALVARSRFQRAVVSTVGWLARPPCAVRVFGDDDAALAWASARLGLGRTPSVASEIASPR